jgi:hypothetical protein
MGGVAFAALGILIVVLAANNRWGDVWNGILGNGPIAQGSSTANGMSNASQSVTTTTQGQ